MIQPLKERINKLVAGLLLLTTETLLSLCLFLVAVVVFAFIAKYVFWDQKAEFDQEVFSFFERFISDENSRSMAFFTFFGNYQFLVSANLLLIVYFLLIRRHRWYSIKVPAIALGSVSIMLLLKAWFSRPRPLTPLLGPALGYSFPSGHAMSSVTFFGLLIYFTWKSRSLSPWMRYLMTSLLVSLILLIGISRVYLRVHYASDVLAGFCVGVIWLFVSIKLLDRFEEKSKDRLLEIVDDHVEA